VAVFYGLGAVLFADTGERIYTLLGFWACVGTLLSAALASYHTWRKGKSSFTSVSGDVSSIPGGWRGRLTGLSDALARRDFVYAVPVLALCKGLFLFLWMSAIGANVYFIVLVVLSLTRNLQLSRHPGESQDPR